MKETREICFKCEDGLIFDGQYKKCTCANGRSISATYVEDLNQDLILNNLWKIQKEVH